MCRLAGESPGSLPTPRAPTRAYSRPSACPPAAPAAGGAGGGAPLATGRTAAEVGAEWERHPRTIAFLTRPRDGRTLELYGWAELGVPDGLTRSGRWDDLDTLVTDEVDDALVPPSDLRHQPA